MSSRGYNYGSSHEGSSSKASKGHSSRSKHTAARNVPIPRDGFDVTDNHEALPEVYRTATLARLYIEFLRVDTSRMSVEQQGNTGNHAIIKVDFRSTVGDDYVGAKVSIEVDWDVASTGPQGQEPSQKPGRLKVKPVHYRQASTSSARTLELQVYKGLPLEYLILCLMNRGLHLFSFVNLNDNYYGCRDWVAQAVYQLNENGYAWPSIRSSMPSEPQLPVSLIYQALGLRFRREGYEASPIDRGVFVEYQREVIPEMAYAGTTQAQEIEAMLAG